MHIGYTVHRFWPAVGGTELAMMDLATELIKLGHETTVITSDEPGAPAQEDRNGIHIRRFAMERKGKFRFPPKQYREFVTQGPWDVLHVKGQRVWSSDYIYRHLGKFRGPTVFTAHGFHQWHMYRHDPFELAYYRWWIPRNLNRFDRVIALTSLEVEEMIQFGVKREKIVLLPDGVNLDEYKTPPARGFREKFGITRPYMLLYAGGFYDNKRVDFLVEAAAKVKADVELVIIGKDASGGPMREQAEALAKRLGAPVRFLGMIDRADLVKAFFEADLFLLASKFEGYGIVLLEAMAAGTPFVAAPSGAAPDLAGRGAGRLASTPEEMARVVDELLADPAERARIGAVGKEIAHAQTIERAAKQHEALYSQLLADRRS